MKEIDFNRFLHSITYWLSYQERIGRSFMIQESSLKYPLADYLTGWGIPINEIVLEFLHPKLKNRRIDLVKSEFDINKKNRIIDFAVEFKMATHNTKYEAEQKRIFNDLMRLYLISNEIKSPNYFVICGKQTEFINSFRSIIKDRPDKFPPNKNTLPKPFGHYADKWFGFKLGEEKTFKVKNDNDDKYKPIYDDFLVKYLSRDEKHKLVLPKNITTKCIAISPLSRKHPTPYVGGIWEVK